MERSPAAHGRSRPKRPYAAKRAVAIMLAARVAKLALPADESIPSCSDMEVAKIAADMAGDRCAEAVLRGQGLTHLLASASVGIAPACGLETASQARVPVRQRRDHNS